METKYGNKISKVLIAAVLSFGIGSIHTLYADCIDSQGNYYEQNPATGQWSDHSIGYWGDTANIAPCDPSMVGMPGGPGGPAIPPQAPVRPRNLYEQYVIDPIMDIFR